MRRYIRADQPLSFQKGNAHAHLAILRNIIGCTEEQIETFFWGACEAFFAE